jgi:para-nitrobenzyl esterase
MMVSMLMASPRAKSLFQRAIGQSGGMFEPVQLAPNYLLANAERDGEKYASSLGASSLRDLRNLPTSKFVGGRAASVSHPVIEPYVLPMTPYEAFSSGRHNDVPLLIGYNAEEARSLTNVATVQAASFEADIKEAFGELPSALIAAYSYSSDEEARQARLDFERDLRFGWDMWAWARLQARNGRNKAFFYYFNHRPPFPAQSVYEGWGASHFAELWYVFDHQEQEPWRWSAADKKLASNISSYWVNFANAGDPNGRGLPEWPPFSATSENVLYLASPISIGAVPNAEQLKGFDTIYSSLRNTPIRSR